MIKTALITGASSGIGKAFADALHAHGYRVILVARRQEILHSLCETYNQKRPGSALYYAYDLIEQGQQRALEEVIASTDISLLIANAGRGSFGSFEEISRDAETEMVLLNVVSSLRCVHAVIPQMKKRRSGSIVIVSSIAAFQPLPFMATYAATKAFNFTQAIALHQELKPFGIGVLAVCPGPTDTEFGGVARVPGTVTGISRDSASLVASESLEALGRGTPYVITGTRSKLLALASRLVPISLSTWILARKLGAVNRLVSSSRMD